MPQATPLIPPSHLADSLTANIEAAPNFCETDPGSEHFVNTVWVDNAPTMLKSPFRAATLGHRISNIVPDGQPFEISCAIIAPIPIPVVDGERWEGWRPEEGKGDSPMDQNCRPLTFVANAELPVWRRGASISGADSAAPVDAAHAAKARHLNNIVRKTRKAGDRFPFLYGGH